VWGRQPRPLPRPDSRSAERRLHPQKAFRVEMRDLFPVEVADRQLVQEVNRRRVRLVRPIDGKEDVVGPKR